MLYQILIIAYVLIALALIGLVLIQQGKGADMGASFGAGSSATVFGSGGSGNFLTSATTYLAVAFFAISLILGNLTANRTKAVDEWNNLAVPAEQAVDAIPGESLEATTLPAAQNSDVPASDEPAKKEENSNVPD
ncbi:preprotein translocase subunit SecG [Colwellia psychrerythraea]|uniref:Protein-export membrane protein SecG n=1 Tax=Colwellia psychrerythraea TaxID=28229 RepID=A0A099KZ94_COLPS|nr:preprotein translocase subunit SecG [Colwellia psychrerythraea]KGJ96059.1 preprotein translocase, SecG subunit [Colwellia psychrerythraea]